MKHYTYDETFYTYFAMFFKLRCHVDSKFRVVRIFSGEKKNLELRMQGIPPCELSSQIIMSNYSTADSIINAAYPACLFGSRDAILTSLHAMASK